MSSESDPFAATAVAGSEPTAATTDAEGRPRDAHVMLEIGKRLGDRYDIVGYLGEGGMGAVYRAFDVVLGEEVALKVVRGTFATGGALRDEVRIAQKVTHANVCRTYDLEDIAGYHLVKMEYIAGESLAARIARGPLPIDEAVRITRAVIAGLEAAHVRGIVHRDLKPGNVMLDGDRVVLMDFGLARQISDEELERAGTPGYMSPEQLAGGRVTIASDYYALGCLLYEMVTGTRAFAHGSMTEVAVQRATQRTPPDLRAKRPQAPRWLARAMQLLMANEPERRAEGLRLIVDRAKTRRRNIAIASALAVGILLGSGWWIYAALQPVPPKPWAPKIVDIPIELSGPGTIVRPALSPDGKTLAFLIDRLYEGGGFIYTVPFPAGGMPERVPNQKQLVRGFRWLDADRFVIGAELGSENAKTLEVGVFDPRTGTFESWGAGHDPVYCNGAIVTLQDPQYFSDDFSGDALVMYARGAKARQLVPASFELDYPRCDPSGTRIVYRAFADGIWLYDGKVPRQLSSNKSDDWPAFTRDARAILFTRFDGESASAIYVRTIDSIAAPARVTMGREIVTQTEPSPVDDNTVVFLRAEVTHAIVMHEVDTGASTISSELGRDVRELAVMPGGLVGEWKGNIVVFDSRGERIDLGAGALPVSLDGKRIYYRHATAVDEVWSVPIDKSEAPKRVAKLGHAITARSAGYDGLHFLVDHDGEERSMRVDPATGKIAEDGRVGLVIPAPVGPWRAIQSVNGATFEAPGQPARTLDCLHALRWIDASRAACSTKSPKGRLQLEMIDVRDGSMRVLMRSDRMTYDWVAGDGRWFVQREVFKSTAHAITNFASRP